MCFYLYISQHYVCTICSWFTWSINIWSFWSMNLLMHKYPYPIDVFWREVYCCHPIDGVWNKSSKGAVWVYQVSFEYYTINYTIPHYHYTILYYYTSSPRVAAAHCFRCDHGLQCVCSLLTLLLMFVH